MQDGPVAQRATPVLPVVNVDEAIQFYRDRLGFEVDFTWETPPTYASVRLGEARLHLTRGIPQAPVAVYLRLGTIDEVDELHERYQAIGGIYTRSAPESQPYGMREFEVSDPDGHRLRFGAPLFREKTDRPPVAVSRVELHTRLERRLAGMLVDLAGARGVPVGRLIEDVVLRSMDPDADSPWTARDMHEIASLREAHGLDYGADSAEFFVEPPPG